MKNWMKATLAASLIAVTGMGATAALARGGNCGGFGMYGGNTGVQGMTPEQMQARMAQRADLRLARLELALALQPEQQPAWNAFKSAMSERMQRMGTAMAGRVQQGVPVTALERLQRMEEMNTLRQTEMAGARDAVERFYATLSDAQKRVFDAGFAVGMGSGGWGAKPGGWGANSGGWGAGGGGFRGGPCNGGRMGPGCN